MFKAHKSTVYEKRAGEAIKLKVLEPQTIGDERRPLRINIAPFTEGGPVSLKLLSAYFIVELTDAVAKNGWTLANASSVIDQMFWEIYIRDTRGSMDQGGRGTESIFVGHTRPLQINGVWCCVCDTNTCDSGLIDQPPIPLRDTELDIEVVVYYAEIGRTVAPALQAYTVANRKYFPNGVLINFELRREDKSYLYTAK